MEAAWQGYNLKLQSGQVLSRFQMWYWTNGPYRKGQKCILISHALTANARADEWWQAIAGLAGLFGSDDYHLVCLNQLGSSYGSTGPLSINPLTTEPYYYDFPELSIKDLAQAQWNCLQGLSYAQFDLIIGASLGGQVALELCRLYGPACKALSLVCSNAQHSGWGIAFNESQRKAISLDPSWESFNPDAGKSGMALARSIAMLSYRSHAAFEKRHARSRSADGSFEVVNYQEYQGRKIQERFNAFSYWTLSRAMDSHQFGAETESPAEALNSITCPVLLVGIKSDLLFPWSEQVFMRDNLANAKLLELLSEDGHDGFLIEDQSLAELIASHLDFLKLN